MKGSGGSFMLSGTFITSVRLFLSPIMKRFCRDQGSFFKFDRGSLKSYESLKD